MVYGLMMLATVAALVSGLWSLHLRLVRLEEPRAMADRARLAGSPLAPPRGYGVRVVELYRATRRGQGPSVADVAERIDRAREEEARGNRPGGA